MKNNIKIGKTILFSLALLCGLSFCNQNAYAVTETAHMGQYLGFVNGVIYCANVANKICYTGSDISGTSTSTSTQPGGTTNIKHSIFIPDVNEGYTDVTDNGSGIEYDENGNEVLLYSYGLTDLTQHFYDYNSYIHYLENIENNN